MRRGAVQYGTVRPRRRRFHTGIFRVRCVALRYRMAPRRTRAVPCRAVPDPV